MILSPFTTQSIQRACSSNLAWGYQYQYKQVFTTTIISTYRPHAALAFLQFLCRHALVALQVLCFASISAPSSPPHRKNLRPRTSVAVLHRIPRNLSFCVLGLLLDIHIDDGSPVAVSRCRDSCRLTGPRNRLTQVVHRGPIIRRFLRRFSYFSAGLWGDTGEGGKVTNLSVPWMGDALRSQ